MRFPVSAITLDLDDTIWPIAPVIVRAETALRDWLLANAPRTAQRWSMQATRELRVAVADEHPHLAHDFTQQRRIALERMFHAAGDDTALVAPAFDAFFAARCDVTHYDDSLDGLQRLAAHVPLAALSNGNACLKTIGLMHLFAFQLGAREHGAAKPAASIFLAACELLDCAPARVLHVGDDVDMDVVGAAHAGLRTCWINRPGEDGRRRSWPRKDLQPDLEFATLTALADWLDAAPEPDTAAA